MSSSADAGKASSHAVIRVFSDCCRFLSAVIARFPIPEIMDGVFKVSDTSDLACIALVCRTWSELALDRLWEDRLKSLVPLLKMLGPLIQDTVGGGWVS